MIYVNLFIHSIYTKQPNMMETSIVDDLLNHKSYNEDIKNTTQYIINNDTTICDHINSQ